jgi:Flp pilus assembly protein protease CpaA
LIVHTQEEWVFNMPDNLSHLAIDVTAGRYAAVVVFVLIAGLTDALWLRISNWLTLPLLVGGLLFHAFAPMQMGFLLSLFGAILGFVLVAPFFAAGGMGAGDVKLLAGIGAWIGPHDVLVLFIVSAFLVGLTSIALTAWNRKSNPVNAGQTNSTAENSLESLDRLDERGRRARMVPMGTMIALALLMLMTQDAFRP